MRPKGQGGEREREGERGRGREGGRGGGVGRGGGDFKERKRESVKKHKNEALARKHQSLSVHHHKLKPRFNPRI